jgi:uncharacterized protein YktA (UPF0223 family)
MTDTEKKIEAMDLINELKMYFKAIVEARRTDKTLCPTLDRPTEFAIAESAKREIGKQVRLATEALEKIAQFKGGKG